MENGSSEQSGDSSIEDIEAYAVEDDAAPEERRDDSASGDPGIFRQPFLILSCLLIVAAAVFLLLSHTDAAFVATALGVSAWFWNMRVRLNRQFGIKKQSRER